MKSFSIGLTVAAFFITSSMVAAQQQYDSLGSPTPATGQNVSPNAAAPNVPSSVNSSNAIKGPSPMTGAGPSTTGSGTNTTTTTGSAGSGSVNSNTGTATPSGLTND